MRKLLLSLILILGTLCSNANIIELANYQDGFGRERSINLVLKDDKPSSIIIPCEKEDGSLGYVLQPIDYLFSIQTYIEELRQKYIEWTQTAVSNGIEEYEKKFAASGYLYGFIWYNPNKRFGSSEFNAVWKYGKDSNIVEITAKVVDTSGSYEIADFSITFSCQNDFDLLLNAISTSNIQSHIPISTDSLFQQMKHFRIIVGTELRPIGIARFSAGYTDIQQFFLKLSDRDWKWFRYDEVFKICKGFYNKKPDHNPNGDIPFIGATDANNGVTSLTDIETILISTKTGDLPNSPLEEKLFKPNCITVSNNGSVGYAFYQSKAFTCSHDVNPLYLLDRDMNKYIGMFLCSIIELDRYRWNYGRKWRPIRMPSSMIKLPVNSSGKPDWQFMEEYIKCLPFSNQI